MRLESSCLKKPRGHFVAGRPRFFVVAYEDAVGKDVLPGRRHRHTLDQVADRRCRPAGSLRVQLVLEEDSHALRTGPEHHKIGFQIVLGPVFLGQGQRSRRQFVGPGRTLDTRSLDVGEGKATVFKLDRGRSRLIIYFSCTGILALGQGSNVLGKLVKNRRAPCAWQLAASGITDRRPLSRPNLQARSRARS